MIKKFAAAICAVAAAVVVAAAPQAQAAGEHKLAGPGRIELGLHFTGYDPQAAAQLGLEIKTNSSGLQYTVKRNASPADDAAAQKKAAIRQGKTTASRVTANGTSVYNNYYSPTCGNAWLRVTEGNHLDLTIDTGFELNSGDAAWSYRWGVILVDQGGTSRIQWGPNGLADQQNWTGHRYKPGLTAGWGYSTIDSPFSYAVLDDASTCNAYPVQVSYHIWS